jgi:hypothetical protein
MIDGAATHDSMTITRYTVPPPLVQQRASIRDDGKEEEMMALTAAIIMAKRCRKSMPERQKDSRLDSGLQKLLFTRMTPMARCVHPPVDLSASGMDGAGSNTTCHDH